MRTSGKLLAEVLSKIEDLVEPGMTTQDIDNIAESELKGTGGKPAFLGYQGFPSNIFVSVNDEVVHGIPRPERVINSGDLVGIDFGVQYEGMITDSATTVIAGKPLSKKHLQLVEATRKSMYAGIRQLKDGVRVGSIGKAVERVLAKGEYGIVRDLVGHGVGHELHEDPNIPNYGRSGTGPELNQNMTVAIEPMATLGGERVYVDTDGWTIKTSDGSVSAHFEHTVLITESGSEILTSRPVKSRE